MKITRYSKDVDILMVKVSDEPIAYAEEAERFIVHFSKDGKPALLEIMDAKDFVLESLDSMLTATLDEGIVYVPDKKERNTELPSMPPVFTGEKHEQLQEIAEPPRSRGNYPNGRRHGIGDREARADKSHHLVGRSYAHPS